MLRFQVLIICKFKFKNLVNELLLVNGLVIFNMKECKTKDPFMRHDTWINLNKFKFYMGIVLWKIC
jgi:hypothetical protein